VSSRLGRGALLVGALLVLLLLALQLRGQVYEQRATKSVGLVAVGRSTPALVEQAHDDLRAARRLRPDGETLALESLLRLASGQPRAGAAVARRLVRGEPKNFNGWAVIYLANLASDPHKANRARREALEVNPLGASTLYALASLPAIRALRREPPSHQQ
jgi:hypothetical protein